jgi:hypothetical protein
MCSKKKIYAVQNERSDKLLPLPPVRGEKTLENVWAEIHSNVGERLSTVINQADGIRLLVTFIFNGTHNTSVPHGEAQ